MLLYEIALSSAIFDAINEKAVDSVEHNNTSLILSFSTSRARACASNSAIHVIHDCLLSPLNFCIFGIFVFLHQFTLVTVEAPECCGVPLCNNNSFFSVLFCSCLPPFTLVFVITISRVNAREILNKVSLALTRLSHKIRARGHAT